MPSIPFPECDSLCCESPCEGNNACVSLSSFKNCQHFMALLESTSHLQNDECCQPPVLLLCLTKALNKSSEDWLVSAVHLQYTGKIGSNNRGW